VSDVGAPRWVGRLLVATPALEDPNFRRCVVLVLDHDDDGALGVVLDRPLDVPVAEVLPGWEGQVGRPGSVFGGGPVSTGAALGVAALRPGTPAAPLGWRRMFGDTGLIDLDTPVQVVADAFAGMRIFAGYSGWGAGQLETEVEEGSWPAVAARGLPRRPGAQLSRTPRISVSDAAWGGRLRPEGRERTSGGSAAPLVARMCAIGGFGGTGRFPTGACRVARVRHCRA